MSSSTAQKTSVITPSQKFEGHGTRFIDSIVHLPDGQRIITCSSDGLLRAWNLKSGKQVGEDWREGEDVDVWSIALSPDGKKVVCGYDDGGVKLWNTDSDTLVGKFMAEWIGHTQQVTSVCWSRDGQRVLSGSHDGTARQWDVENKKVTLAPIDTGYKSIHAVIYSPDATMIATGGYKDEDLEPSAVEYEKSSVKIWNAKTRELVATLKGHSNSVNCLAWSLDGKTLISGSTDHSIRTWNTTTWKQISLLDEHTDSVLAVAILGNGRVLASASHDKTVRLWNLDKCQPISSPLSHPDAVTCVSFSADGKLLATGADDSNAYTWDVYAILREAGLDGLLLDVNSILAADATRRPVQPIKVSNRIPRGFFDDSPHRPAHLSSSARPHTDDTPSQPSILRWARNLLSGRPSGTQVERHKRSLVVVDVPYAKGKRRNASARERRKPIQWKPTNSAAGSSRPPNSNVTQQPAQAQSSSQPQVAISMSSTTPPVGATTNLSTNPNVTIQHAGRWTRFWLHICCASTEYTHDGHH